MDDANHGIVLLNDGKANFSYLPSDKSGIKIKGDVRSALLTGRPLFVGVNNDSVKTFILDNLKPGVKR
jgi:hypothetical protein